ncbi:MAG TPA: hypothetical protein VL461_08110 [Dictyobacter sp.]|jgi:hypothetical protein|nr:hypothetical protein [Dictyobacter sp.]
MARRFRPQNTPKDNLQLAAHAIPWKLLILVPVLVVFAIPTFYYGARVGDAVLPAVSNVMYSISNPPATPVVHHYPAFPTVLPQSGAINYTVGEGDNCDSILTYQMRMSDASTIFSDANPNTVQALDQSIGQDCHKLQPGMLLHLSPQYPLVAMGGILEKIESMTPAQAVPKPLIPVQNTDNAPDCTNGCALLVKVAPTTQVRLIVYTSLALHPASWVWFQASMALKPVAKFANYPYADPAVSFNGMTMHVCSFQVDTTYDSNSLDCDQLSPTTIDDDNGSWMLGVTGSGGLDHWKLGLKNVPANTRLLFWTTQDSNGNLAYHAGNPIYRYDPASHLYVKLS